jgi:hypothetical protein
MCISPVEFEKFFPQKEHLNVFGVAVDSLPDLLRFSLRLSEHQNIVQPYGSFNVSSNNSPLVPSLQDPHSDLYDFSSDAGPADYLGYFSWD